MARILPTYRGSLWGVPHDVVQYIAYTYGSWPRIWHSPRPPHTAKAISAPYPFYIAVYWNLPCSHFIPKTVADTNSSNATVLCPCMWRFLRVHPTHAHTKYYIENLGSQCNHSIATEKKVMTTHSIHFSQRIFQSHLSAPGDCLTVDATCQGCYK